MSNNVKDLSSWRCRGCGHGQGTHDKSSGWRTWLLRIDVCTELGCDCKRYEPKPTFSERAEYRIGG